MLVLGVDRGMLAVEGKVVLYGLAVEMKAVSYG